MIKRQNFTSRIDQFIQPSEYDTTVGDFKDRHFRHSSEFRLYLEARQRSGGEGLASYCPLPRIVENSSIIIFLKYYDYEAKRLK